MVPAKRLGQKDKDLIVMLRGCGYSQGDIAKRLGVSQSSIGYQLNKIKKYAEAYGYERVYREIFGRMFMARLI